MLLAAGPSVVQGQSPLDGFDPNANYAAYDVIEQPDGKILVCGNFTTLTPNGGAPITRNYIARLNSDGTVDIAFDPNANDAVFAMFLQPDGRILVGGHFTSIGGQTRSHIARLDGATGLADSFDPNANSVVGSFALTADGKILVGGYFLSIGGQARHNIARLDAVTGLADSFDPNANNYVYAIGVQADGKVLVGGAFTTLTPNGGGIWTRRGIARLNEDGTIDNTFNANANNFVSSMALTPDGKIIVGGGFEGTNSIGGQNRNYIARLDATTGLADSFNPNADSFVYSTALQADGSILAGGRFFHIGGQPRRHLARLDAATGSPDSFNANLAGDGSEVTSVGGIAVQADGKVLAVGKFDFASGQSRKNIARFGPLGAPTPTPTATPSPSLTPTPSPTPTPTPGPATHFTFTTPPFAISCAPFNFTVTARDSANNTATGYAGLVHFTSTDPAAILPANSTLTNGVGTFQATLHGPVEQTITATDTINSSITGTSNPIPIAICDPTPTPAPTPSPTPTPTPFCVNDTWSATSFTGAPIGRFDHTAVWTGSEMIVWGGFVSPGPVYTNTGGKYNPVTNSWTATSTTNAPPARENHTAVWTGTEMIVWGGHPATANGGRYNPNTNTWTATSSVNAPATRSLHTAVWTGSEMIVWGGFLESGSPSNTGGKYNPSTDTWTPTNSSDAPFARYGHTAVWTGTEMIVWGGNGGGDSGARYNPTTDSWTPTSITNAPQGRDGHSAIWTGNEMIVWGGQQSSGLPDTGGRYNPMTDSWTATSITNAPLGRNGHSAVWTGSEMIIWGGAPNGTGCLLTDGGRYNPTLDNWTPTQTTNAPQGRNAQTEVWTGHQMIVWGGVAGDTPCPNSFWPSAPNFLSSGGKYCAESGQPPTPSPTPTPPNPTPSPTPTPSGPTPTPSPSASPTASEGHPPGVDIAVTIADSPDPVQVGQNLTYTITVSNLFSNSGFPTPTVTMTDNLPASVTFVSVTASQGSCTGTTTVTCSLGLIAEHQNATVTLVVTPTVAGALTNTAFAWPNFHDVYSGNNEATAFTTVIPGTPTPTPTSTPTQARNLATRLRVQGGDNVGIGGFIIAGNASKTVAIRGIGPSLAAFGISDFLADPTLELRNSSGLLLKPNDNWQDDPADAAQLTAHGLGLQDSKESGIVATLQPGTSYTAILAGKNQTAGVGLIEIYDIDQTAGSELANISTRGFVLTGNNVMIGGFILGGSDSTRIVVRGIGPSLAQFGLNPVLIDPTLELHDSNGATLISNNDWQDDPASAAQLISFGLAPQNIKESAIATSLPPGAFTGILAGNNGGTGIGLIEIYNVH